jgi:predicted transcriptional regulator
MEFNMKAIYVEQLDEKGEEIADALISLGMSRYAAMTLSYLQNVDEAAAVEIEKEVGLHQPEVSIAMKELKERGWINEREEKKPGKGMPHKIYSLKIGLKEIVSHLEKQQRKAADEASGKIHRLRGLMQPE